MAPCTLQHGCGRAECGASRPRRGNRKRSAYVRRSPGHLLRAAVHNFRIQNGIELYLSTVHCCTGIGSIPHGTGPQARFFNHRACLFMDMMSTQSKRAQPEVWFSATPAAHRSTNRRRTRRTAASRVKCVVATYRAGGKLRPQRVRRNAPLVTVGAEAVGLGVVVAAKGSGIGGSGGDGVERRWRLVRCVRDGPGALRVRMEPLCRCG